MNGWRGGKEGRRRLQSNSHLNSFHDDHHHHPHQRWELCTVVTTVLSGLNVLLIKRKEEREEEMKRGRDRMYYVRVTKQQYLLIRLEE